MCVWLFDIRMYVCTYTVHIQYIYSTYSLCVCMYDCCKWRKSESLPLILLRQTYVRTYIHTYVCLLEHDSDILHLQQSQHFIEVYHCTHVSACTDGVLRDWATLHFALAIPSRPFSRGCLGPSYDEPLQCY